MLPDLTFYSHWRSLAAYRVRVALALKGIAHKVVTIDISTGEHRRESFLAINPQGVIPALALPDGTVLSQSLAILEYLDEIRPRPPLLPQEPAARARVRSLALIHAADVHPLLVPRVRARLSQQASIDDGAWKHWAHGALLPAMQAMEALLANSPSTGRFCHGDAVTLADIGLSSQWVAMALFGCDTAAFPTASRICASLGTINAFAQAHPLRQPDAPGAARGEAQ